MRNRLPNGVCALVLVLASSGGALAQTAAVKLTLADAQARAQSVSRPRVSAAFFRGSAAAALAASRGAADRPIVSASGGYTRTNHVTPFVVPGATGIPRVLYPDVPDNYRMRLDLQWPIYSGGRIDALERAAVSEAAAIAADAGTTQTDLRLEAARAFWALVTAQATVAVLEQGVTRAQAHLTETRERFDAGLVPPNEVASAEAQESRSRMLLIEARNQRDVSHAELARLTGIDPAQTIEPAAALDAPPESRGDTDALLAEARATRPERRALEHRLEAARQQYEAVAALRRPTVTVAGGLDYARPNPRIFPREDRWQDSWDIGVNVGWTLWDSGRSHEELAAAAFSGMAARQNLEEFDSVVSVEVRQRVLEIDSGRAAIAAATEFVRAATEARRVVAERYRAGVITQTEVLDAEFALLQSELDRTRALANLRFAEARLARALGR